MDADIITFENFALSSRGLLARPILPNNKPALRADIAGIDFLVRDITNNLDVASGSLDPVVVMFTALQTDWRKDTTGYSFLWALPGAYTPTPNAQIRFKITFTIIDNHSNPQLSNKSFIMVYQANVRDPIA